MQTRTQGQQASEQQRLDEVAVKGSKRNRPDKATSALLSELVSGKTSEQIFGHGGLLKQLSKMLIESALEQEMVEHLGHRFHQDVGNIDGNVRNGYTDKTLTGDFGQIEIAVPRDRHASFEPQIVPKHARRIDGFDQRILCLYARGLSTREIAAQLLDIFGAEVSPAFISSVTDTVVEEVRQWQARPLEAMYPIVYLDCLMVKTRESGAVANRAIYLAIGVNCQGIKEVLGIWTAQTEGAKFWLSVMTDLKSRGLEHILIACVDGLKGFPQAISTHYPQALVQLCIVHMVRNSLNFVGWKDKREAAAQLRAIYTAASEDEAKLALDAFATKWDGTYPQIAKSWRANWENITPFFSFEPQIRRVIYTTNAIESVNYSLRRLIKTKGSFPSDEAAVKLLYLGLRNISKRWSMPIQNWKQAMSQFMIRFDTQFTNT
jgi:putative transposase